MIPAARFIALSNSIQIPVWCCDFGASPTRSVITDGRVPLSASVRGSGLPCSTRYSPPRDRVPRETGFDYFVLFLRNSVAGTLGKHIKVRRTPLKVRWRNGRCDFDLSVSIGEIPILHNRYQRAARFGARISSHLPRLAGEGRRRFMLNATTRTRRARNDQ